MQKILHIAKLLIENGANPNALDAGKCSPVHVALAKSNPELARCLLAHGATSDLRTAAALGDVESLKRQYAAAGNKLASERPTTPQFEAFLYPDVDPFGTVNISTPKRLPASGLLCWAAHGGSAETIEWLASLQKLDLNGGEEQSPLFIALCSQQLPAVRALLEAGADANGNPDCPYTLLEAVDWGNPAAVRLLLDYHVNVEQTDLKGQTALHLAAKQRNLPVVKLLVEAGVPLNATYQGSTALELAMQRESQYGKRVALYLLDAGADPRAGRHEALYWHVRFGDLSTVERLLEARLNPNRQTATGSLALIAALERYGQRVPRNPLGLEMLRLLLAHGADPEVPSANLKTPLDIATDRKYQEAVEIMRAVIKKQ